MTGTPIIAAKTGGLTKQVVNDVEGGSNGVAVDMELKTLVGSQNVPYIYEDYVSSENIAKGIMKLYHMDNKKRTKLSNKVLRYAKKQFNYQKMIDSWHDGMLSSLEKFKNNKTNWDITEY